MCFLTLFQTPPRFYAEIANSTPDQMPVKWKRAGGNAFHFLLHSEIVCLIPWATGDSINGQFNGSIIKSSTIPLLQSQYNCDNRTCRQNAIWASKQGMHTHKGIQLYRKECDTVVFIKPGITLGWRAISTAIAMAVVPTDIVTKAEISKETLQPAHQTRHWVFSVWHHLAKEAADRLEVQNTWRANHICARSYFITC